MNNYKRLLTSCMMSSIFVQVLYGTSLVYNMRLRRAFAVGTSTSLLQKKKSRLVGSVVPVFYKRKRHIVDNSLGLERNIFEKRLSGGAIFNIRYIYNRVWWAEVTTGIEREHAESRGSTNFSLSRTGIDDIVLSAGRNFLLNKDTQFTLYGIAGFPTRRKVSSFEVQDPLVGTRFFSIGVGSEIAYSFINTLKRSLIVAFQNRFLHFFSRQWFPSNARIQPGNGTDLLFILNYREKKNIFEAGYGLTLFTNQALILESQEITSKPFLRNNIYASFAHIFLNRATPMIIGTGFNIGLLKRFDTKVFLWWLNMSIAF